MCISIREKYKTKVEVPGSELVGFGKRVDEAETSTNAETWGKLPKLETYSWRNGALSCSRFK